MKNKNVAFMTQAAMIAAIYVVLTYVFAPFSFGEVQIRIAEALTILPVFTPAAIPGLFVGCIVGKHSRRSNPAGYHFRKHCNFDRSHFLLSAS